MILILLVLSVWSATRQSKMNYYIETNTTRYDNVTKYGVQSHFRDGTANLKLWAADDADLSLAYCTNQSNASVVLVDY